MDIARHIDCEGKGEVLVKTEVTEYAELILDDVLGIIDMAAGDIYETDVTGESVYWCNFCLKEIKEDEVEIGES